MTAQIIEFPFRPTPGCGFCDYENNGIRPASEDLDDLCDQCKAAAERMAEVHVAEMTAGLDCSGCGRARRPNELGCAGDGGGGFFCSDCVTAASACF